MKSLRFENGTFLINGGNNVDWTHNETQRKLGIFKADTNILLKELITEINEQNGYVAYIADDVLNGVPKSFHADIRGVNMELRDKIDRLLGLSR